MDFETPQSQGGDWKQSARLQNTRPVDQFADEWPILLYSLILYLVKAEIICNMRQQCEHKIQLC